MKKSIAVTPAVKSIVPNSGSFGFRRVGVESASKRTRQTPAGTGEGSGGETRFAVAHATSAIEKRYDRRALLSGMMDEYATIATCASSDSADVLQDMRST